MKPFRLYYSKKNAQPCVYIPSEDKLIVAEKVVCLASLHGEYSKNGEQPSWYLTGVGTVTERDNGIIIL